MKLSKNFYLDEFIPPEILNRWGDKSIWFIDPKIISIAQALRDRFGKPVTINDWKQLGRYSYSGLRGFNSSTGAEFSQHKYGRAIDVKIKCVEPLEVQKDIITNFWFYMDYGLTAMELNTPTWTHLDCRNTDVCNLFLIKTKYPKLS